MKELQSSTMPRVIPRSFPEVWGGIECSVNRVGDTYFNQLSDNGHWERLDDLDRFAALGLHTLRYPVLWELVAPDSLDHPDWTWTDQRLSRLRELGMTPIAGLVHHGSGPRYTSLIDPAFPAALARYARLVAQRYPWVEAFTPVNEPLTTARFSALYGHWYPHGRNDRVFVRTLLQQCAGIVAAMKAIREVTPAARLIMTEDMGMTYTPSEALRDQADFENNRRWLSLDLLFGRVDREHPLRHWLILHGATIDELDRFIAEAIPPDIVGLNYYVTSDRVLDDRLNLFPRHSHGGNGRQRYADTEAVRGWRGGIQRHREVLAAAWQRYGKPVAVTEAHLGCTREEQLRWFMEAWQAAIDLSAEGVDVRAVTAWSLLGAFDWNTLLTQRHGCYESGVFDLRGPEPRPTLLARMVRELSHSGRFDHPVLSSPGWWRRSDRLLPGCAADVSAVQAEPYFSSPPLLIVGGTGTLGQAFARLCAARNITHHLLQREEMDIGKMNSIEGALDLYRPWAVINAAGYVRVDEAEDDVKRCFRENTDGPAKLAAACNKRGVRLVTFSSDLVFDGLKQAPYHESDRVSPLNIYGMSKAEAERLVLEIFPSALVIRCSAFFGPWDRHNFITATLAALKSGAPVRAAIDLMVSPTYVPDLVHASLDLLLDESRGIWHITNLGGGVSWAELANNCARLAGLDGTEIVGCSAQALGYRARRPKTSVLSSERGVLLPTLDDALHRYFVDCAFTR